jgi:hypothetical protein
MTVDLVGLLTHWPFLDSLTTALIAAKTKITWRLKEAAALRVATVRSSATKIANAASTYDSPKEAIHRHIFFLARKSHRNIFSLTSEHT